MMTVKAMPAYTLADLAHGSSVRRTATTRVTAAVMRTTRSGLLVRLMAIPQPAAQAHHDHGWTVLVLLAAVVTGISTTGSAVLVTNLDTVQRRFQSLSASLPSGTILVYDQVRHGRR